VRGFQISVGRFSTVMCSTCCLCVRGFPGWRAEWAQHGLNVPKSWLFQRDYRVLLQIQSVGLAHNGVDYRINFVDGLLDVAEHFAGFPIAPFMVFQIDKDG